jgi:hypothetical protein
MERVRSVVNTPRSTAHLSGSTKWALRMAGICALVNGAGFGAFDVPAMWHLSHDHEIWQAGGNPTYGDGPFEAHGFSVTVLVQLAFFGACLVLAIGGALLLVPRTAGVVVTVAGLVMCAPFWWGFDLPFAWFSAATILILIAVAGATQLLTGVYSMAYAGPELRSRTSPELPHTPTLRRGRDESRSLQRAGWAGAVSVVLLVAGVAMCSLAGVDAPGVSDATILARVNDGAKQAAAGIGLPMIAAGTALLLWFAVGLRRVLDRLSGGDPLVHSIVPAAALLGGLVITGVTLDVSSAVTALATDEFTPDPDISRVLGTAGALAGLTGLAGGAVMVAGTARILQHARALPRWAVWLSYVVAALCLSGFWSGGMASVAFALWLIGAVIGVLRSAAPALERERSRALAGAGGQP